MSRRPHWHVVLLLLITPFVGAGCWWLLYDDSPPSLTSSAAKVPPGDGEMPRPRVTPQEVLVDAELALLRATDALIEARLTDAEALLHDALKQEPHFRLAHALLGDILRARSGLPSKLHGDEQSAAMSIIQQELKHRIQAPEMLPPTDVWPQGLVSFSPFSPHAFVVDAQALRMYWLRKNERPEDPPRVIASFYVSVGKAGVGKQTEGDNKTPLGVYHITHRRTGRDLPAFYGAGALVLDYPHAVDRLLGRTGSGIWLHGSPPNTYTRDPLASEGCVVLSNSDMQQLMQLEDALGSPVLILPELKWVSAATHRQQREEAIDILRSWARQHYGLDLLPDALGIQRWFDRDGHWYWRVEYRVPGADRMRYTWFFREQEDGLIHVAGNLPPPADNTAATAKNDKGVDSNETPTSPTRQPATTTNVEQDILKMLHGWASAWARRDLNAYFSYYHPNFSPKGLSQAAWKEQRRDRIMGRPRLRIDIEQPRIRVQQNRATVTFIQRYQADNQPELRTRKTLHLERVGSQWRIVEEQAP